MSVHWDTSVDVLSIGSGLGGLATAIAARDAGLEALVLERSNLLGGSGAYSYGILWVPNNHLQAALGIEDSLEQARQYMAYLGGGRQFEDHVEAYLEYAPRALRYFEETAHVPFYVVGVADHYYPAAPGSLPKGRSIQVKPFTATELGEWQSHLRHSPYIERITFEEMAQWGGRNEKGWDQAVLADREARDVRTFGAGLIGYFLRAAADKGVGIMAEADAERLIVEDGAVVGVEVKRGSESLYVQARKAVMIATGGYAGNERLVRWLDEFPPHPPHRPPAAAQGKGLVLALDHGAALFIHHGTLLIQMAYAVPGDTDEGFPIAHGANLRELPAPHSMLVNRKGERFGDESFFEHLAIKLREFDLRSHEYLNRPCFLIFDQDFWDRYALSPVPPGGPVPSWVTSAASVEELATKLNIDRSGLAATVERFNGFAETGRDLDFHRGEDAWSQQWTGDMAAKQKNPHLGTINRPPFYGIELHPCESQSAGLVTTPEGQVMHVRGHPIPRLYACGDVAARLRVGIGYQAGYVLTGSMTTAYMAVQQVAGRR